MMNAMERLAQVAQEQREAVAKALSKQVTGVHKSVVVTNGNVVAGNKMLQVVDAKVDSLDAKVERILAQLSVESKAVPTQPTVEIVKCARCGFEIKSQAVITYCKNRKFDGVYCSKCQQELGLAGKNFKAKEIQKPQPKGIATVCSICKGKIFFDTKEDMAQAYKRATEAGLPGIVHKGCARKLQEQEVIIHAPIVEKKVEDTKLEHEYKNQIDSTQFEAERREEKAKTHAVSTVEAVVNILAGKGVTPEDIKAMSIKDVRKFFVGINVPIELDGNDWNKSKAVVVDNTLVPASGFRDFKSIKEDEESEEASF